MAAPDLQALVADANAADPVARERAFAELMRLVSLFVRARMGNRLRDHRESADVVQSIARSFIDDAARGMLRFDSPGAFAAYLQQVVKTKLAELHRYDTAAKRGGPDAAHTHEPDLAEGDDTSASVRAMSEELLQRVLAELTHDEADLVRLRRRGMGWTAIATATGESEEALRKRWSRLQSRITEALTRSR
jgi:RNA polymerase sigma factor (sigma-70 family)